MSSLWYFIADWAGLTKILGKIKALLCNYLWSSSENTTRVCVRWDDCTLPKKVGSLSLYFPGRCYKSAHELVDHSSISSKPIKFANSFKVPYHKIAIVLPWLLGSFLSLVFLSQFLYHRWLKGMASYCSIVKGDGTHSYLSISIMFRDILQLHVSWKMKNQCLYFGITMANPIYFFRDI